MAFGYLRWIWILVVLGALSQNSLLLAQTENSWTNPASGRWEDATNWFLGILPASNQNVSITNSGYKAVGILGSTVSGFPDSLTVSNLTVSAPGNALSTLLLNYTGTSVPLHVLNGCTIGANGSLQNFYSSLQVDGSNSGSLLLTDGGQMIQEGGLTVITPSVLVQNGTINATNSTMNLGQLKLGNILFPGYGSVYQSGGTLLSAGVRVERGNYTLLGNGTLYALDTTALQYADASFTQFSGTNFGDVVVSAGSYQLRGGLIRGTNLYTAVNGGFNQYGGTAEFASMEVRGSGTSFPQAASYSLQGGMLRCGSLFVTANGTFRQAGGTCILTNGLYLGVFSGSGYHAGFQLADGNLFMPSMVVSNLGQFEQSGGTNQIAGDVAIYETLLMFGGRFTSANLGVGEDAFLGQFGGSNEVSGVVSVSGHYQLAHGTLSANGIYLRGTLEIPEQNGPPILVNHGLINFGGTLTVSVSQSSMGQLGLSTNGTINLNSFPIVLRFADSSNLSWAPNASLVIVGWNGAYSGGGYHQIYFGNNASGLDAGKLTQVRFLSPGGQPQGYYAARILSTGEVVPVAQMPSIVGWGIPPYYHDLDYPGGLMHDVVGLSVRNGLNIACRADGSIITWPDFDWMPNPPPLTNVIGVAAGGEFYAAVTASGSVAAWGGNYSGQTNVPSGLNDGVAVAAGNSHAIALRSDRTIVGWGLNSSGSIDIPSNAVPAIAIAAGEYHNLALRSDNNVVAWGLNGDGQCSVPSSLSDVRAVAAGGYFSMALKSDGTVVCWGRNDSGECNVPAGLSNVVAIAGGWNHALALCANGTVVAWGDDYFGQTNLPPWLTNMVEIAAGQGYSLVVPGGGIRLHGQLTQPRMIPSPFEGRWFTVSVPSRSGQVFLLEYVDSITQTNWTPLPLFAGRAGSTTLYDYSPIFPSRLYRVRQW